jgi:hypothetical protein
MHRSRRLWEAVERFHAGPVYLEPECRQEAALAGAKGFWMSYFATRAAPLGAIGPDAVEAIFFYFAPVRVRRALPDAWRFASPQALLDARYRGVDAALRRLLGEATVASPELAEAAALARQAVRSGRILGRPLFAGWAGLPWPDAPHLQLWHAATVLREHRSGSHLVALAAEGLDGCETVVSHAAAGGAPEDWIEGEAGWTAAEAGAARERLADRGWLDGSGAMTPAGHAGRDRIEAMTDALDDPVWAGLGDDGCTRLEALLGALYAAFPPDDQLDWEQRYPPQ